MTALNGVVLISYLNELRVRGRSLPDAVRLGADVRFRPVLMTALVASVGFIANGDFDEQWCRGAAAARDGGDWRTGVGDSSHAARAANGLCVVGGACGTVMC